MNMLSFLGETPTIALRLAQEKCGEEAIVISTKKISNRVFLYKRGRDELIRYSKVNYFIKKFNL